MNGESDRKDREELEEIAFMEYLDRCIMEALIEQMSDEYTEKVERQAHTEELIEKTKRVRNT